MGLGEFSIYRVSVLIGQEDYTDPASLSIINVVPFLSIISKESYVESHSYYCQLKENLIVPFWLFSSFHDKVRVPRNELMDKNM